MCTIGVSNRSKKKTLEEEHKGEMHKMEKYIEETQAEGVECFV